MSDEHGDFVPVREPGEVFTIANDPRKVRWEIVERTSTGYRFRPADGCFAAVDSYEKLEEWFRQLPGVK